MRANGGFAMSTVRMGTEDDVRHLFETNPQPIFVYDVKTLRILAANEAFLAEYGFAREELEKMDARQLHPPEDAGQLGPLYEASRSGVFKGSRKVASPGMRHRRKDGSAFHVETLSSPVSFKGFDAQMVVVRDVSDRSRLAVLEARNRALFDHSRDILLVLTWDGRIVDANRAAVRAYGYPRDELVHLKVSDLRDPATLPEVDRQIERAQQDGIFFETRHRRRDGDIFPVEVSSTTIEASGERLLLSVVRDTSDRRKAFEDQRGADSRFQLLVDEAPFGLALVRNGRILHTNPAFAGLVGASDPAQLSGAAVADFFAAVDRVEVARLVSVRAGEPSSEHQLRLRSTTGPDVPVKVIARAAPFEGGTAVVLGIRNVPAASS
jgi:PAS domain S-box-containing protein